MLLPNDDGDHHDCVCHCASPPPQAYPPSHHQQPLNHPTNNPAGGLTEGTYDHHGAIAHPTVSGVIHLMACFPIQYDLGACLLHEN